MILPLAFLAEGDAAEIIGQEGRHGRCHGCCHHAGRAVDQLANMGLIQGKRIEMITNRGSGPGVVLLDEAATSLLTGVIAKEIVVSTMGEVYLPKADEEKKELPSVNKDLKQIGISFGGAFATAAKNVFSTFGIATMSTEAEGETAGLRSVIAKAFTPLSAYAFMDFVLLYLPCFIVLVAMRHEFGTWKWAGVTIAYQTVLAWCVAFIIYQGGRLLGF